MTRRSRGILAGLLLTWSLHTGAQPIAVDNAGFEADFAADGTFPVMVPSGWTLYDPGGIVNQSANAVGVLNPAGSTFFFVPVPEGRNAALVYLEQRAGTLLAGDPVGLQQTLGAALAANTRYTLSVSIGNIATGTGQGAYAGLGEYNLSGFPGYRVELLAGGQVIASEQNGMAVGEGLFGLSTLAFTTGLGGASLGQPLGIRLINLNATGNVLERGREVDFDNVTLIAAAVPEPGQSILWLCGLLMLTVVARRGRPSTA